MNLTGKLIVIFLLLAIAPLSLVGWMAYDAGRNAIEHDVIDRLTTTTLLKEAEFAAWLEDGRSDIRALAQRPLVRVYAEILASHSPDPAEFQSAHDLLLQDHFLPRMDLYSNFVDIALLREADGVIVAATEADMEGKYRESEAYFVEGLRDTFIGSVTYEVTRGEQVMHISTPVRGESGTVVAVLVAHLNLADISEIMTRRAGLRDTEETYLVNTFNFMVTESLFVPDASLQRAVYTRGVTACLDGQGGSGFYDDYRGVPVIGAYRWMPDSNLCIVTEMDESEALTPIIDLRNSILLVGVIIGLGAIATGVFLARTITTPVRRLAGGTQEIAAGNLKYRVGTAARDEIGQLSRAFDHMVEALEATTVSRDELAAEVTERQEAEAAVRRYADRLAAINRLDRIISAGLEIGAVYDNFVKELLALMPVDRTAITLFDDDRGQWQVVRQWTHYEPAVVPDVWRPVQGSVMEWVLTNRAPLLENEVGEGGTWPETALLKAEGIRSRLLVPLIIQDHIVGVFTVGSRQPSAFSAEDQEILTAIADQLAIALQNARLYAEVQRHAAELEQRVAERTAQLEASNKELEAFSYSVSHDLRAPLRAMDGFSRILLEDYAANLDDDAQRYLGLVRENAQQMGRLIDHLLTFSRLGRQELKVVRVAPEELVRSALADLTAADGERDITVEIGDLPPCRADPALLRQVFANLLGNAFKFTKTRKPAIIEVGCNRNDGELVYFVRDNGTGFDMKYANKLFGVFQRLHRAEDYEGTGVGLATVQRIVHRHGGRIWAEAEIDKGATFYFTLGGGKA